MSPLRMNHLRLLGCCDEVVASWWECISGLSLILVPCNEWQLEMNPENMAAKRLWGKPHLLHQSSLPEEVFIDVTLPSLASGCMSSLMMDRDSLELGEKELAKHKWKKTGVCRSVHGWPESGPFHSLSLMATAWWCSMPPVWTHIMQAIWGLFLHLICLQCLLLEYFEAPASPRGASLYPMHPAPL